MQSKKLKRGIAIETALVMVFVLVALSIILTTVSAFATNAKNNRLKKLTERVAVDSIGEDFLEALVDGEDISLFTTNVENYLATVEESSLLDKTFYSLTLEDNGKVALFVKVEKVNTNYKIVEWKHG